MARKTQVTKEIILQAALELLIEKGFSEVNVKTLSHKIGCSTQPIVWHFDHMDGLREALAKYALSYANKKLAPTIEDESAAFKHVGISYIKLAIYEPNLFRFLYMSGESQFSTQNFDGLLNDEGNPELIEMLSSRFQISKENAGTYLQNTVIYTHGIAALIAAGVVKSTEMEIMNLIDGAASSFLLRVEGQNK